MAKDKNAREILMLRDINTYRLVNVRSIQDSNDIMLPQLSVLVGKNGSGKSSFMRFFQILSQSYGINKRSPILFYGNEVDFGSFEETLSDNCEENYIGFGFSFQFKPSRKLAPALIVGNRECLIFCKIMKAKEMTYLSEVEMHINDDKIIIKFLGFKIHSIVVNGINYSKYIDKFFVRHGFIIPDLLWDIKAEQYEDAWFFERGRCGVSLLVEMLHPYIYKQLPSFRQRIASIRYSDSKDFTSQLQSLSRSKKWTTYINSLSANQDEFFKVKACFAFTFLTEIISNFNDVLKDISQSIYYVGPFRAAAQRYYRMQELDISRIDSTGNNVPAYINSLNATELDNFSQWVESFFGFAPAKKISAGHTSVSIRQKGENALNLADVGYGYSQILPIVIQLWQFKQMSLKQPKYRFASLANCYIFLIEQPELHLHPALQRRLLNAIVDVLHECKQNSINLKIILETHSEKIIDELGLMIEKELFDDKEASVYLFEKENGICTITQSSFDKFGVLMNWPFGFFDGE